VKLEKERHFTECFQGVGILSEKRRKIARIEEKVLKRNLSSVSQRQKASQYRIIYKLNKKTPTLKIDK